jgi:hypothetical protein
LISALKIKTLDSKNAIEWVSFVSPQKNSSFKAFTRLYQAYRRQDDKKFEEKTITSTK